MQQVRKSRRKLWVTTAAVLSIGSAAAAGAYVWTRPPPLYGHVVFGRDAALRLRFIACGLDLYWDRNADDVPQRSEFVGTASLAEPIELADADGATRYTVSGGLMYTPDAVTETRPQELDFNVDIAGPANYSQYGGPALSHRPEQPGIAHFHGPLAVRVRTGNLRLAAGGEPSDLRVEISTYQPNMGGWAVVCSSRRGDRSVYAFPPGIAPEAEIDFPSNSPGSPPIKRRFLLDEFC
jgi:hypothetical protein